MYVIRFFICIIYTVFMAADDSISRANHLFSVLYKSALYYCCRFGVDVGRCLSGCRCRSGFCVPSWLNLDQDNNRCFE